MVLNEDDWPMAVRICVPITSVLVFCAVSAATYYFDDPGLRRIKQGRRKKLSSDPEIPSPPTGAGPNYGNVSTEPPVSPSNGMDYNSGGDGEILPLMVSQNSKTKSKPVKAGKQTAEMESNMNNAACEATPLPDHSLSANASISSVSGTSSMVIAALRSNLSMRRDIKALLGQPAESNPASAQTTITGNVPRRRTKSDSTVDVTGVQKTFSETQVHLDVLLTRMAPLRGTQAHHKTPRLVQASNDGKRNFAVTTVHADGSEHSRNYPRSHHGHSRLMHKRFRTVSQDETRQPPSMHSPATSVLSVGAGGENFTGVGKTFTYNPQATVTSIASAYATIPAISEETDMG